MPRRPPPTPAEVLAAHQFPETGEGRCIANDGWGLYAQPEVDENRQMADHQIEMLAEAGYRIEPIPTIR